MSDHDRPWRAPRRHPIRTPCEDAPCCGCCSPEDADPDPMAAAADRVLADDLDSHDYDPDDLAWLTGLRVDDFHDC